MTSHYDWRSPTEVLAWARLPPERFRYFLFTDQTRAVLPMGERWFNSDGHCSFSPDRRWVLTDTYPHKEPFRRLVLYRWPDGPRVDIGRFFSPPELDGEIRCDLHPRWNRDGRQVCIDSAHEGVRQMYVLDVGDVVK